MADEKQKSEENVEKEKRPSWRGGPMGLGDPNDTTLRKVEKDILIAKMVRERAKEEKCIPEVAAFNECCKAASYSMVFKCRKQNSELRDCLERWYKNDQLWEECRVEYLKERESFRRTGEPKKIRDFKARYQNAI